MKEAGEEIAKPVKTSPVIKEGTVSVERRQAPTVPFLPTPSGPIGSQAQRPT